MPSRGLTVSVDGRPLDAENLRSQGIGRYAHGLLGELPRVAEERGGKLVVLRERGGAGSPFAAPRGAQSERPEASRGAASEQRFVRSGPLPLDLVRGRAGAVHHALSLYGTPLVSRSPLVVTMHDVAPLQWPGYLRTGLLHRMLYRAVRRAAAVVCPSRAARDDVIEHLKLHPDRVHVVPEGVDERFTPTASPGPADDEPYLLYVGGLVEHDPRKNVAELIDAFAGWSLSEGREETLVLAGAMGPAGKELEKRARDAGARVVFAGFVDDDELPALYSGAGCLVTASRYEGFGLPALEAIACGTPVVAYEAGAIPKTAGPGALLVAPGDASGLMRAAGRVCDDPELAQRLSAGGLRHAAGFTWRRTAEMTWDVYERV